MNEAKQLLAEYDEQNECLPWKAWAAGSMVTRVQAASEELDKARERFCQAVLTGKALEELAAERVARTPAGRAPAGTFIVRQDGRCITGCVFLVVCVRWTSSEGGCLGSSGAQ